MLPHDWFLVYIANFLVYGMLGIAIYAAAGFLLTIIAHLARIQIPNEWLLVFRLICAVTIAGYPYVTSILTYERDKRPSSPEEARLILEKYNIPYNEIEFIKHAKEGNDIALKLFLVAGMNPNLKDGDNMTALAHVITNADAAASQAESRGRGKHLYRHQKLISGLIGSSHVTSRYKRAVKVLLDHGADRYIRCGKYDKTALELARDYWNEEILRH